MTSLGFYFIFSNFWFFWVVSGGKMAKSGPKRQKGLSCFISQKTYIIWFSFMVHFHKMIISWVVFFILSKFWFSGLLVEEKSKKWSKVRKNLVRHTPSLRNHTSYDFHLCIYGTIDNISRNFFFSFYQNFDCPGSYRGQKGKKYSPKLCPLHLISKEPYIIWLSFVVNKCKLMISAGFFFKILIFQ